MAVKDSIRYARMSTYCGVGPIVFNAAIFLFWYLFRSDSLVVTWMIAFIAGLAVVLVGTICLLVATVHRIVRKQSSWPMSGLRTLATVTFLFAYFPTSAITASSYLELSRRPSVDVVDAAGRKNYKIEEVTQFLDDDPSCVNARDEFGETALHVAANRKRLELVKLLIARGADVQFKTASEFGETALHQATDNQSVPIIDVLIETGVDPNTKNKLGSTPLHYAAEWAHVEVVKALLGHGADVNATDGDGKTPLDLAAAQLRRQSFQQETWIECVRLLKERGGKLADSEQPPRPASLD